MEEILAMTQAPHEPVRREQESGQAHEQAVNEIHYAWLRFIRACP